MKKRKIKFIPGWLDHGGNFPQYDTLDIWKEKIEPDMKIDGDVVVAHSLGCHFVLSCWENLKDKKIIFINPLAVKRSRAAWFIRWLRMHMKEGHPWRQKFLKNPLAIFRGLVSFFKYTGKDVFPLIKINGSDMMVIRGKEDAYFCDEESCRAFRNNGINVVELDGVGHLWNGKIDEEIKKIIKD